MMMQKIRKWSWRVWMFGLIAYVAMLAIVSWQKQQVAEAQTTAGTVYYVLNDHQGSVAALVKSTGEIALKQSFDPWGNLRHVEGDASLTSIGWQGEYRGHGDGLVWLRARHYDPTMGRFLQRDSIDPALYGSTTQEHNRYAFGVGNPVMMTDPSGHGVLCNRAVRVGCSQAQLDNLFRQDMQRRARRYIARPGNEALAICYAQGGHVLVLQERGGRSFETNLGGELPTIEGGGGADATLNYTAPSGLRVECSPPTTNTPPSPAPSAPPSPAPSAPPSPIGPPAPNNTVERPDSGSTYMFVSPPQGAVRDAFCISDYTDVYNMVLLRCSVNTPGGQATDIYSPTGPGGTYVPHTICRAGNRCYRVDPNTGRPR